VKKRIVAKGRKRAALSISREYRSRTMLLILLAAVVSSSVVLGDDEVLVITWRNFTETRQGEWMLELYVG